VRYRLTALEDFALELARVQGVRVTVTDQLGQVLTGPLDVDRAQRRAVEAALAGGTGTVEDEQVVLSYAPAGALGWGVLSSVPTAVAFAAGDVLEARLLAASVLLGQLLLAGMVLGVRSDLRRRTAQSALAEREAHLSSVLEAAGDAFLSVDAHGEVAAWNAQAAALYGRDREQVLGTPALALLDARGRRASSTRTRATCWPTAAPAARGHVGRPLGAHVPGRADDVAQRRLAVLAALLRARPHRAPPRRGGARRGAHRRARGLAAEVGVRRQHEPRDPHADERRARA
jgi:PAS domain-containing protein